MNGQVQSVDTNRRHPPNRPVYHSAVGIFEPNMHHYCLPTDGEKETLGYRVFTVANIQDDVLL